MYLIYVFADTVVDSARVWNKRTPNVLAVISKQHTGITEVFEFVNKNTILGAFSNSTSKDAVISFNPYAV